MCDELRMRQSLNPLAEGTPFRQAVIPALEVDDLELPVVGRHPGGHLEARRIGIENRKILLVGKVGQRRNVLASSFALMSS